MAAAFLEQRVHVLVEKPMTTTTAEADRLLALAEAQGVVLAVGHTERFNPAVAYVKPLLAAPRFIEVHRLGTFPERSLDIDVVFDLMIHDLDLVLDIVGGEVTAIEAVGVPVLTPRVDIANVRLRFDNGCIANLTASRISRDRVRKIRFFQKDAYVSVDYAAQEVEVYRLVGRDGAMPAIEGGKMNVNREEPLKRELEDFVGAIREGRPPVVTGAQGRAALALAERVVERMEMTT
jgi:predicted dehydrogenase